PSAARRVRPSLGEAPELRANAVRPMIPRWRSVRGRRSAEHALALKVDHLLGLGHRKGNGILAARIGIGTDEVMLLEPLGRILFDAAGGLVLAAREVGGGTNPIALIFHGFDGRLGTAAGWPARQAGPQRFQVRKHVARPIYRWIVAPPAEPVQ